MTPEYKNRLELEVESNQEPRDVHFTWQNITDQDWERIVVNDDTRIVKIEKVEERSVDEGDVAEETVPIIDRFIFEIYRVVRR